MIKNDKNLTIGEVINFHLSTGSESWKLWVSTINILLRFINIFYFLDHLCHEKEQWIFIGKVKITFFKLQLLFLSADVSKCNSKLNT